MPRTIEIPILIVLIIITAYFYFKERKKSYLAAKAIDEQKKNEEEAQKESKIILTVTIDGMMCEKCAQRVKEALGKFGEVNVSLENKCAEITSEELPDAEEVKDIITNLGYTVTKVE